MPIAPLPEVTVRAIGSSLVLNDACSVVKELVDNALDANATSVVVEISLNTLEVIQVKDNGHGIGIEDRQLVGKRGCTSKIRTMEDLERLGGSSLGFRGEALASLMELSEAVTVTTRVDGEMVGTMLKFGRDGVLQKYVGRHQTSSMLTAFGSSSSSASHPVGTTCQIWGFLNALPVRKEAAKKAASKTIASIKKLLFNYAYARPSIRFALKVLKASNERANWSYSPSIGAVSLRDTTVKIAGQEVAALCELRSADLQQTIYQSAAPQIYSVDAVIVKTDAEPSKIHKLGQYISVDGRPVEPARGVIKDIIKIYKSFYRAACGNGDRKSSNVDPFLCMHIRCPPESYDVNIEPAKDDVLFSEPSKVIAIAEKLFTDYYGDPAPETPMKSRSPAKHQAPKSRNDGFDLLLARKASGATKSSISPQLTISPQLLVDEGARMGVASVEPLGNAVDSCHAPDLLVEPASLNQSDRSRREPTSVEFRSSQGRPQLYRNMYGIDGEDLLTIGSPPPADQPSSQEEDENDMRSGNVTNPWSLAKLSSTARPSVGEPSVKADQGHITQPRTPGSAQDGTFRHLQRLTCPAQPTHPESNLPSPITSSPTPAPYQNPGPQVRRRACSELQDQDGAALQSTQDSVDQASHLHPAKSLDTWVRPWQPVVRLPSFRETSVSSSEKHKFGTVGRSDLERQERNVDNSMSSQLTEADAQMTEHSSKSDHVGEALQSPLNRCSVSSARHIGNLKSLNSLCTNAQPASPPPNIHVPIADQVPCPPRCLSLIDSGDQITSMPPPPSSSQRSFQMCQASNTELADILEFEQRKKAVVLHQRKSHSNRALEELNPANLAHVQRKSNDISLVHTVSSQLCRDLSSQDLGEEKGHAARYFERGAASPAKKEARSLTQHNSPHQNRYLAAKQRLNNAALQGVHRQWASQSDQKKYSAGELFDEAEVQLTKDDPRAYLARNCGGSPKTDSLSGVAKTSMKVRRTKTARLPLETIPAAAADHGLRAISQHPFPSTSTLARMSKRQGQSDKYVRSGENCFVKWSANSKYVTAWETTLQELISQNYQASLPGGEAVAPEVAVELTTAIKAHVDAYDL